MPWHIQNNHSECPSGRPWAVVKDGTGEVEGCHPSREAANDQLAALHAAEADQELQTMANDIVIQLGGKPSTGTPADRRLRENRDDDNCPEGHHRMPDGSCMPDDEMAVEVETLRPGHLEDQMMGPFKRWHGVLAVEGVETGDGREFAPGSLEWGDPAEALILLQWQRESEPKHNRSVTVGRIDHIERDGELIRGFGVIDLGSEDGAEVARLMRNKLAGGVSVDVDSVKDADIELVFPDASNDEEVKQDEEIVMLFGPPPEKVVFHRGRIRAATLVALPAFAEARLVLDDDEDDEPEVDAIYVARDVETLGAIASHDTGTYDDPWDSAANEARLPSPMSVDTARDVYAWMADGAVEDGEVRKTDLRFPHHTVGSDGQPGAASIVAASAGIGILNGARGGTNIPAADRRGVYDHLAAHLRDAGREPPPLASLEDALVAAGATEGLLYPPLEWFQNPQLDGPTAWRVTDEGRVYGHLALWSSCHTTFPDRCVTPPRERDYPYFMRRELKTREGEFVGVGPITLGTGHASLRVGAVPAVAHYDDTGLAAVDVAVGEDRFGIWVAGALRPEVSELRLRELRGASLSGDWRRIGGKLRLVAVLAVNVPGYPVPRMRVGAQVEIEGWSALVAAGVVTDERAEHVREVLAHQDEDGTIRVRRVTST